MPEYLSNKKRKQSIGINSYSEYTDTTKIIGNVLVGFGSVGVGTTVPTQDVDVNTIRVRDTLYDYTNSGGVFGYYLVKDTGGIKWVAVPPIDSNAIFVAENNNILGVSSFTGINIISDELLGVTTNTTNPNFADITILPRWLKSGDTGIYTTKNVGIGTTIPTTDFQVGFGSTGVTIDGSVGVVSALGYYGNYAFIDQITVKDRLNVVGLGSTLVAAFLGSGGGITTTGGDLYVGGTLFANKLDIINLKVVNIEATGITTLNVGIVSTFRVTGVSTLGVTSISQLNVSGITTLGITSTKDLYVDENLYVVGIATATRFSTGVIGSAINITSNTISGPAEIIIDPADIGDNSGAVRIKGDLFVDGEEFIVNSTTIELADFNVGIASTVGTNLLLDGAGIGIGSTNIRKTLTYDYSSDSLKSSENFDLGIGKVYKINETEVLSSTQLTVANINATGVSTLGFATIGQLYVSGVSTFVGVGTFINDLYVGGDLYVADDIFFDELNAKNANITGITTLNVGIVSTFRVTGVSTLGVTSTKDLFVDANLRVTGITTLGITSISQLNVSGITTLGITSTTNLTSQQLNVSGITTLGITSTTNLTSQQLNVSGITTLGVTSTTNLTSQQLRVTGITTLGVTTISQLYVSGVSTFVGVGTFIDNLYVGKVLYANVVSGLTSTTDLLVDGNLRVTGITTLGITSISQLNVSGITTLGVTSTTNLTSQQLIVSGITTLGVTSTTNLTSQQLNVSGITTLGITTAQQLYVSGVSTFVGVGTFIDDLYVGRVLYAKTVDFDNIEVENIKATGISTLNVGIVSTLTVTGVSTLGVTSTTNLTSQQLNVSGITTLGITTLEQLYVSGVSTFVGVGTFSGNLYVGGDLYVADDLVFDEFTARNINVTGISSLNVGIVSTLTVSGISTLGVTSATNLTSQQLNVTGITTLASIVGISLSITGISTIANFLMTPVGTGATVGGIGVTYYGDGSQLTKISSSSGYADNAGIATNVIGGIASVTSLNVTGITTLSSIVGTSLSITGITTLGVTSTTNLTSQQLNVSGITTLGVTTISQLYVSGVSTFSDRITGIISTAAKLETQRTFEITGDVVASPIFFDGTGNVSLAATIQANSVGLGTDTFGDYVKDIKGTVNEITVTSGTGEGSSPTLSIPNQFTAPQDVTVSRDLQVNRNLNVSGNITIGGTSATLFTQIFKVADPDIILGVRTDGNGNDISTDNTANHGGIAIASTDGNPLIILTNQGIGETLPATYKKFMWFKAGSFAGLGTDAWLSNYAIGIGSTQFPAGTVLAAGSVQFSKDDLKIVRNINASGIITATEFKGTLTGYASSAGITTHIRGGAAGNVVYQSAPDTTTFVNNSSAINGQVLLWNGATPYWGYVDTGSLSGSIDYAVKAGIATYADTAGIATNIGAGVTGNIPYQSNIGITTFVDNSSATSTQVLRWNGSAPVWGDISAGSIVGVVTYADRAGIATNVIGGIASVSQLNVSGITTLGVTSTTNLTTQQLLVTGITTLASIVGTSLSISGISTLGVTSTTNLTSQQLNVSGITTLRSIVGTSLSITGISTIANFRMSPVGTGATVGGIGVTYYGDGSGLTNINLSSVVGVVTYAERAGIATNVIGGIASVTSLNVTGITTLSSIVGTSLSISGISTLGITSTTNLTTQQLRVTGITTLASIVGTSLSITGISTIANFRITNVGTGATVGGIGVTYYGDGSNLTGNIPNTIQNIDVNAIYYPLLSPSFSGTISSITVSSNSIVFNPGTDSLGIGTTNPGATLNVVPTSSNIAGLFSGTTSSDMVRITQLGTGNALVVEDSTNPDATPFVVTGTGSVGIGTTNPTQTLDVSGRLVIGSSGLDNALYIRRVTDNTVGVNFGYSSTTSNSELRLSHNAGTGNFTIHLNGTGGEQGNAFNEKFRFTSAAQLGIGRSNPSAELDVFGGANISTRVLIGSATSTGTASQALQVTGGAYVSGNVGIGTTNPTSKLTVQGDVLVSGILTASRIVGTSLSISGISTIANFLMTPVGTGATVGGIGVTYYGDGSQLTNVVSTSGYATSAGISTIATNVIGGIASVTSLSVTGITTLGSVEISSGIVTAKTGIVTYYGDGSQLSGVSAFSVQQQEITTSPVYPTFASNTNVSSLGIAVTQVAYIPASGNLGIGTTNPTSKLTVVGDVLVSGVLTATRLYSGIYGEFVGGSISGSDIVGTSLSITGISAFTNGPVLIGSATSTGTVGQVLQVSGINSSAYIGGNLGIGTTNPQYKLDVIGDLRITGNIIGDVGVSGVVTATSFIGSGSSLTGLIPNTIEDIDSNQLYYPLLSPQLSGTISSISISSNSIVFNPAFSFLGIGTTNPQASLDILTVDGYMRFGDVSDFNGSTDNGISFVPIGYDSGQPGVTSYKASLFTEVDGRILSYGINVIQLEQERDINFPGGIFRIDTRISSAWADADAFVVKRQPIGLAKSQGDPGELNAIVVKLTSGDSYMVPNGGTMYVGTASTESYSVGGSALPKVGGTNIKLQVGAASTPQDAYISGRVSIGTTDELGVFQVGSGSSSVVVTSSGNLGIGTTTPTSKLTVQGDVLVSGILTASHIVGTSLSITGISTLGTVKISSGIITSTTGIVTYYGDGRNLTNVVGAFGGIGTAGGTVGTGITFLDFRGSGISSITVSAGIATITIPGASRSVNSYVATENQTTFAATYSVGYADVYLNGSKLSSTEYIATNGTSIILTEPASLNDIVEIVSYLINITGGSSTPDISPVMMGMIF